MIPTSPTLEAKFEKFQARILYNSCVFNELEAISSIEYAFAKLFVFNDFQTNRVNLPVTQ